MKELNFPKNFLWGSGTSSHQVEGDNTNNDWWEAEKKGLLPSHSGKASEHYSKFAQDFEMAKKLGHNAYRFSIEWSRIEPEPGEFNKTTTVHYRRKLIYLREHGIEPIITLHHFTNPLWFTKKGGWKNRKSPQMFARYVKYCKREFGDFANWWITINEPGIYAQLAYQWGKWPPFKKSFWARLKVLLNMSKAHRLAYKIMKSGTTNRPPLTKEGKGGVMVGISQNVIAFLPASKFNVLDRLAAGLLNFFRNHYFLRLTRGKFDFIGINYYFQEKIRMKLKPVVIPSNNSLKTDLNWEIAPQGLLKVLKEMHKYRKPILITENGIADKNDNLRWPFILNHLLMVYTAIAEGIDIRGYLYWSLLDNYEWGEGFESRFGLIEIDYGTQKRKIRESAWKYAKIARENAIHPSLYEPFVKKQPNLYPEVLHRHLKKINLIKPEDTES